MIFLGGVGQEQIYQELSRCAVLCLPSFAESLPLVIAQAQAAGKAVVATRVGGVSKMIDHGKTGLVVEPGNVMELLQALRSMLADAGCRRQLGTHARITALERYSPASVARKTRDAYADILRRTKN